MDLDFILSQDIFSFKELFKKMNYHSQNMSIRTKTWIGHRGTHKDSVSQDMHVLIVPYTQIIWGYNLESGHNNKRK